MSGALKNAAGMAALAVLFVGLYFMFLFPYLLVLYMQTILANSHMNRFYCIATNIATAALTRTRCLRVYK